MLYSPDGISSSSSTKVVSRPAARNVCMNAWSDSDAANLTRSPLPLTSHCTCKIRSPGSSTSTSKLRNCPELKSMAPASGEPAVIKIGEATGASSLLPPNVIANAIIAISPTTQAMAAGNAHLGSLGGTVSEPCSSNGRAVFSGPVALI